MSSYLDNQVSFRQNSHRYTSTTGHRTTKICMLPYQDFSSPHQLLEVSDHYFHLLVPAHCTRPQTSPSFWLYRWCLGNRNGVGCYYRKHQWCLGKRNKVYFSDAWTRDIKSYRSNVWTTEIWCEPDVHVPNKPTCLQWPSHYNQFEIWIPSLHIKHFSIC